MGGGGAVWCDCVLCVGCYMYGVNVLCMARDTCYKKKKKKIPWYLCMYHYD